jgi:hypothetical protein
LGTSCRRGSEQRGRAEDGNYSFHFYAVENGCESKRMWVTDQCRFRDVSVTFHPQRFLSFVVQSRWLVGPGRPFWLDSHDISLRAHLGFYAWAVRFGSKGTFGPLQFASLMSFQKKFGLIWFNLV